MKFRCAPNASEPFGFLCIVAADRDRPKPLTVDEAAELLKAAKSRGANYAEALMGGAAAEGDTGVSACEWKPRSAR